MEGHLKYNYANSPFNKNIYFVMKDNFFLISNSSIKVICYHETGTWLCTCIQENTSNYSKLNHRKRTISSPLKIRSRTPWPFSKSKFNLKSDHVNLVAPASPIECLLYLRNVPEIQYKLGPERLTRLGNSNVLRLPVR